MFCTDPPPGFWEMRLSALRLLEGPWQGPTPLQPGVQFPLHASPTLLIPPVVGKGAGGCCCSAPRLGGGFFFSLKVGSGKHGNA